MEFLDGVILKHRIAGHPYLRTLLVLRQAGATSSHEPATV
jgi:hypothetical protein